MIVNVGTVISKQNYKQSESRVVSGMFSSLWPNTVECTSGSVYSHLKLAIPGAAAAAYV